MSTADLTKAFVDRCESDRRLLIQELSLYEPMGVMRLWRGRSQDHLQDITDERVSAIHRELARLDATIELATTVEGFL